MREYFSLRQPTKPEELAFFKANPPLGGGEKPSNAADEETPFWDLVWWIYSLKTVEEIEASPLAAARRRYQDPPIVLEEINDSINDTAQEPLEDIESWPPNNFGRGQVASSFQRSSVSMGWKPKPMIQWKLLGGGKSRKKTEPTKPEEPTGMNHFS